MSFIDDIFEEVVPDIMENVGTGATLVRTVPGYDPDTGVDTANTPTTYPMKIAPPEEYVVRNDTGVIQTNFRMFAVMNDNSIQPTADTDDARVGGITFNIKRVSPIMSGARVVGWWLYLDR